MRVVMFCHSIASDWNHGNAHFLRGIARELVARGHDVAVWEPADGWSARNLVAEHGGAALHHWLVAYPELADVRRTYLLESLDLDVALDGADLVLVHEWSDHELVRRLGAHRARAGAPAAGSGGYRLLFHDTHHRSITERDAMRAYDLREYDGVLAFGEAIREVYLREGWTSRAWTWHEAADIRLFRPLLDEPREGDLVWIGNWGDDERAAELREFLVEPSHDLRLRTTVYGVRYPDEALRTLAAGGIRHAGWLPNVQVPRAFARHAVTVHVPRRPYVASLPGIPTIRPFEALASGVPLVSAPWDDTEGLFTAGRDYLVARNGTEMRQHLRSVLQEPAVAQELVAHGLRTIHARHTCAHRVDELLTILRALGAPPAARTGGVTAVPA